MSQPKVSVEDEYITDHYTPCNSESGFHDLKCGHRVKGQYLWETCGTNCKVPGFDKPFLCRECIMRDVRLAVTLDELGINTTNEDVVMEDADTSPEDKTQEALNARLQKLLRLGQRTCLVVAKFNDPLLQMFNDISTENGVVCINDDAPADPGVTYRRPNTRTPQKADKGGKKAQGGEKDEFTVDDFIAEWDKQEREEQQGQGKTSAGANEDVEMADEVREAPAYGQRLITSLLAKLDNAKK